MIFLFRKAHEKLGPFRDVIIRRPILRRVFASPCLRHQASYPLVNTKMLTVEILAINKQVRSLDMILPRRRGHR